MAAITLNTSNVAFPDGSQTTTLANIGEMISVTSFASSGNYNVPSNCTKVLVQLVGGGGGSAGYGESGGAGGYSEGVFSVTPGATVAVTVGGGGLQVGYYAAAGNGGTSSFGAYLSATGGYGANQNYSHGGGHGGVGSSGQVNLYGSSGTGHMNYGSHAQSASFGGGSFFGGPGGKVRANQFDNYSPAYGSGASGGIGEIGVSGTAAPGGLVVIYAFK